MLQDHGIKVHTGTMVLRNLGTAIRDMMNYSQQDFVANTLRMFSQGIKADSSNRFFNIKVKEIIIKSKEF